ncbi:TatA/E family twin arginine-targeting protein translocase [Leptolyngbya sp. GB1-A1]|jgi:sec-independent protein translocase protein TatA|uniref:TatA/E family twin arginine-targeting protein translocase n=1 Tax=Leptolyngbya sp. GB1-A1 TaxID=2933908 RepID=UPI0032985889
MNFFGIGLPEMTLILVLALLIFGPKKLPEIGRSLGKALRGFQEASKEFENEFKREAERIEKSVNEPIKATLETPAPKALTPAEETKIVDATIADSPEAAHSETAPEAASSQQG